MKILKNIKLWQVLIFGIILASFVVIIFSITQKVTHVVSSNDFVIALQAKGYDAKIVNTFAKDELPKGFTGFEKNLRIVDIMANDTKIRTYEFDSQEDAVSELRNISETGSRIGRRYISWAKYPHIYQSGRLIVIYAGSGIKTQFNLRNILGKQIAGIPWYYSFLPSNRNDFDILGIISDKDTSI